THLERLRRRAREFNRRERSGAPSDRTGPAGEIAVKLEDAARDYYVDRHLNRSEYLAIRDALHVQLARRQRDLLPSRVAAALELLGSRSIRRGWADADLTIRRSVLQL